MIDRKFKTDALFSYLCQVGNVGLGFLYMFLITQHAGIGVFGAISVLVALSSVMGNLLSVRTNEAVTYFFKKSEVNQSPEVGKCVLLVGIGLDLVMGAGIYGLFYIMSGAISEYFISDVSSISEVQVFCLSLLGMFIRGTPLGYLQAVERFKYLQVITVFENLMKTALVGGAILYFGGKLTFEYVIYAIVVSSILTSLLLFVSLWSDYIQRFGSVSFRCANAFFREFFSFSIRVFFSSALKSGNKNVDVLVLGFVSSSSEVGVYSLLRQFLAPLVFISSPFGAQVYPKFIQAVETGRGEEISWAISEINRKLTKIYVLLLFLIVPVAVFYLHWSGVELRYEYVASLGIMSLTVYLAGKLWWGRPFSNSVDPSISLRANLYSTLFILLTLYPLTLYWGIVGTAFSILGMIVFMVLYYRKLFYRRFVVDS